MSELTQKYHDIKTSISRAPFGSMRYISDRVRVASMMKLKAPMTQAPKDSNYDIYGKEECLRLWNKGFYPEIKLLYNERPKGDPNAFAKALINPATAVVSDVRLDNYEPRTRAMAEAINRAAHGNDLIILGNLLSNKYRKRWDLAAEFINDLRVSKMFLILGPYDVFTCDDYIDFGFNFITDRAEKRYKLTKLIYSYFPVPVKKGQLNIHGHPSDNMYSQMGITGHFDASPIYGVKSVAINTLGSIIEEAGERDG